MALFASIVRTWAFLRKEVVEVVRQPRLLVVLVLGPFLVLLVFGTGLLEGDPPVRTLFVVADDSPVVGQIRRFAAAQDERLTVLGLTDDLDGALARLEEGSVELVVVVPDDAVETIRSDRQALVLAVHEQLDPIEAQSIDLFTRTAVDEINQLVLRQAIAESQADAQGIQDQVEAARRSLERFRESPSAATIADARQDLATLGLVIGPTAALLDELGAPETATQRSRELLDAIARLDAAAASLGTSGQVDLDAISADLDAVDQGIAQFRDLSPRTIVSPFEGRATRVSTDDIALRDYYAPAVVALLLQHLIITFVSLSMVRERALGTTELFRVAPITTSERLLGKCLAFLVVGGSIALLLVAGLVWGLGTPLAGSVEAVGAVLLLLILQSMGLAFILAVVSRSDSQAVQYAMLILLASIFFSGFLLGLDRFRAWVEWIAAPLPVSRAIPALRDVMLRGDAVTVGSLGAMIVLAVVYLLGAWVLTSRADNRP